MILFDTNIKEDMSDSSFDWEEFWIRFVCSFLFFGFIFALGLLRYVEDTGWILGGVIWTVLTVGVSIYAAKVGDEAWHKLLDGLRWW